jgi:hypothetical protein
MGKRQKCSYCDELAVAYQLEADGTKTPICAYHIPVEEDGNPSELREDGGASATGRSRS